MTEDPDYAKLANELARLLLVLTKRLRPPAVTACGMVLSRLLVNNASAVLDALRIAAKAKEAKIAVAAEREACEAIAEEKKLYWASKFDLMGDDPSRDIYRAKVGRGVPDRNGHPRQKGADMTHDELAETVAKAIYAVTYKGRVDPWHNAIARRARILSPDTPTVRQARKYANAAIAAVYTVLREATPEIIKAALNADAIPAENSDEFLCSTKTNATARGGEARSRP